MAYKRCTMCGRRKHPDKIKKLARGRSVPAGWCEICIKTCRNREKKYLTPERPTGPEVSHWT